MNFICHKALWNNYVYKWYTYAFKEWCHFKASAQWSYYNAAFVFLEWMIFAVLQVIQTKIIAGSDGQSKHHDAHFDKNNQSMVTFSTVGLQKGKLSMIIINKFHLVLLNREFSILRELEMSCFFSFI